MNNWSNFELLVDMKQIHIKIKIKYLSVYSLVYVNTVPLWPMDLFAS